MNLDKHNAYGLVAQLIREHLNLGHSTEGLATELKKIEKAMRDAWDAWEATEPEKPETLVVPVPVDLQNALHDDQPSLTQGFDADDYNGRKPRC